LTSALDLGDLFHPDTFLNALRQLTARSIQVSMDELKFVCKWGGGTVSAKHCVKIGNLQIEGCLFDGMVLSECSRDSNSIVMLPPVSIGWVPKVPNLLYYFYIIIIIN